MYSQLNNKTHAYQYGNYLTDDEVGFLEITSGGGGKNPKNYKPKKGDIAVFEPLQDLHEGHMQMFNGTNWVSDFVQNNPIKVENMGMGFWAGPVYRSTQPSYAIYRKPQWQEWNP